MICAALVFISGIGFATTIVLLCFFQVLGSPPLSSCCVSFGIWVRHHYRRVVFLSVIGFATTIVFNMFLSGIGFATTIVLLCFFQVLGSPPLSSCCVFSRYWVRHHYRLVVFLSGIGLATTIVLLCFFQVLGSPPLSS